MDRLFFSGVCDGSGRGGSLGGVASSSCRVVVTSALWWDGEDGIAVLTQSELLTSLSPRPPGVWVETEEWVPVSSPPCVVTSVVRCCTIVVLCCTTVVLLLPPLPLITTG